MNEPLPSPQKQTSPLLRVTMALVFGALIATVTLYAGLQAANGQGSLRQILRPQSETIRYLSHMRSEIIEVQQKTHHLPDPKTFTSDYSVDSWGKPVQYTVDGSRFQLISWGSDGKPGGTGLAADLTPDSKPAFNSYRLTMADFLTLYDTRNMVWTAIGTGLLSAVLCLFVTRAPKAKPSYKLPVGWRLLLIFGATAFVGSIITAFHAPNGH